MKCFCEHCNQMAEYEVKTITETYPVYGENIDIDASVAVCMTCKSILFNEELDSKNLILAQNVYRNKHKLLTADEIIGIRKQYGLSQRSFAKLLDWGDKTIRRYEAGAVQSRAHNSLLLFLRNPENMYEYLRQNEVMLEDKQLNKLKEHLKDLNSNIDENLENEFISKLFPADLSIENGYKVFDFDKFAACVLYFLQHNSELLIVKLNKLLNYADMLFFKENGVSLTGTRYIHLPYGPVPDQYSLLYGILERRKFICFEIEQFDNGFEKHILHSGPVPFDTELLPQELEVLEKINNKFSSFGSKQIADYSHNERGYKETKQGDVISYEYAEDIII